jgi:hypothetical protein
VAPCIVKMQCRACVFSRVRSYLRLGMNAVHCHVATLKYVTHAATKHCRNVLYGGDISQRLALFAPWHERGSLSLWQQCAAKGTKVQLSGGHEVLCGGMPSVFVKGQIGPNFAENVTAAQYIRQYFASAWGCILALAKQRACHLRSNGSTRSQGGCSTTFAKARMLPPCSCKVLS